MSSKKSKRPNSGPSFPIAIQVMGEVCSELKKKFVDRDQAIDVMVACASCGIPVLLLGEPGTGKSAMAREFFRLIGLQAQGPGAKDHYYFDYLLTRFTLPDELFGPVDLSRLEAGELKRMTEGSLIEAKAGFLDEVFRGSSAILNSLLAILNEGKYHMGKETLRVQLAVVIAAANNPPAPHEDTHAIYDRFPIRVRTEFIESNKLPDLLEKGTGQEKEAYEEKTGTTPGKSKPDLLPHLDLLQREFHKHAANMFSVSQDRRERFLSLFRNARDRGLVSDRSLARIWRLGCAIAHLNNNAGGGPSLSVFRFLSNDPDESRDLGATADEWEHAEI